METQPEVKDWVCQLPDGSIAPNMKEACKLMGLGAQGFRALIRKQIVKKIQITSKTERYDNYKQNS